jgi:hypothetical protein
MSRHGRADFHTGKDPIKRNTQSKRKHGADSQIRLDSIYTSARQFLCTPCHLLFLLERKVLPTNHKSSYC